MDQLGGTPRSGISVRLIELGGLSPGWGEAALRLWVQLWNEWWSSELGRWIRRGYLVVREMFVPSVWAG